MRDFNVFRLDNTEGFTQEQLDSMNRYYKERVVDLDSTDDNYDNAIQHLQEKVLKMWD